MHKSIEDVRSNLLKLLSACIKDQHIQKTLAEFLILSFNSDVQWRLDGNGWKKTVQFNYAWIYMILYMKDLEFNNLGWKTICKAYYTDLDELISQNNYHVKANIHSFMKKVDPIQGINTMYSLIKRYLIYLSQHKDYMQSNISDVRNFSHLFIDSVGGSSEIIKLSSDSLIGINKVFYEEIQTNFPLNSNYESIYNTVCELTHTTVLVNLNLNTKNDFLIDILKKFIDSFEKKQGLKERPNRIFLYYFEKSLGALNYGPSRIQDFNLDTFRVQYDFYKELDREYEHYINKTKKDLLKSQSIRFYRFLVDYINKNQIQHSIFKSKAFEYGLLSTNFSTYYEEDYEFVFHNGFESMPKSDKWYVMNVNEMDKTATSDHFRGFPIDFSKIDLKFREDVRGFLWNGRGVLRGRMGRMYCLNEFLNFKFQVDEKNKKIKKIDQQVEEFPDDLAIQYKMHVRSKYSNELTCKEVIRVAKAFVRFVGERYNVSEKFFYNLYMPKTETKGGVVITDLDYKLIQEQFRKYEKTHKHGEIVNIIFMIFATTNLRIGEILNLKMDCIIEESRDEKGNAVIRYVGKLTDGEYKQEKVSAEVIKLIERAKEITANIVEDNIMPEFIFIKRVWGIHKNKNIRIDFSDIFRINIIAPIRDMLENKNYKANNIRHTYIDTVYEDGMEQGLSIHEIASIAGNSYRTANQHYRDKNELEMYIETMCKVTFADVDVNGEILSDETGIRGDLYEVKNGLGCCNQTSCIPEHAECLKCRFFITFLSRIPIFEKAIHFYDEKIQLSNSHIEVEEYNLQKKMLGAYLFSMLSLQESIN